MNRASESALLPSSPTPLQLRSTCLSLFNDPTERATDNGFMPLSPTGGGRHDHVDAQTATIDHRLIRGQQWRDCHQLAPGLLVLVNQSTAGVSPC